MTRFQESMANSVMWLLVILTVLFGIYLGGQKSSLSGYIIGILLVVVVNMAAYIREHGQGIALLALSFTGWFLLGFIPRLVISSWGLWFR